MSFAYRMRTAIATTTSKAGWSESKQKKDGLAFDLKGMTIK
jgi:hypothetical protein